jgi:hypothetical protein
MTGGLTPKPLTPEELRVLEDVRPFRIREKVIGSLQTNFDDLRRRLVGHLQHGSYLAPPGVDYLHGKIGQGEHLDGLPYLFVDMPRYISQESSFTYRTLFWWGDGVSFSFILSGPHLSQYRQRLMESLPILEALDVYVSVGENPWEWQRDRSNTIKAEPRNADQLVRVLRGQSYLKCSRFLGFGEPEFREGRVDDVGLYTFQAFEPLVLV